MKRLIGICAASLLTTVSAPALAQSSADHEATSVDRIIVFGDSLSDGGYYAAGGTLPPGAGSFTTNPDPVSPEVFAAMLGLDLQTAYGLGGTNYAVGGARVTAANALSIPIATQIDNFLAAGGSFSASDLVYIQGGGNDFFYFGALGGTDPTILSTAASELATQVRRVQDAGAGRIVTMSVQTGGQAGLQYYNQNYAAALAAANVNALYFDTDMLYNEVIANPGAFGITDIVNPACTVSSLVCTRDTLVSPDAAETHALADTVHPTGKMQRVQGQAIASLVMAPDQIAGLGYATQASYRAHRRLAENAAMAGTGEGTRLFANGGYHYYDNDGTTQRIGLTERGFIGDLGIAFGFGPDAGAALAVGYSQGNGDFDLGAGSYDSEAWSITGMAHANLGFAGVSVSGVYGTGKLNDITRVVHIGPVTRTHFGDTDTDYLAIGATLDATLTHGGGMAFGPEIGLDWERVTVDGYTEASPQSTSASFGKQQIESLTGRVGLSLRSDGDGPVAVNIRAAYEHDFDDDPRSFTMTPSGAPISWTVPVHTADSDYMSYGFTVAGKLGPNLSLQGGASGELFRGDETAITAHAGISLKF